MNPNEEAFAVGFLALCWALAQAFEAEMGLGPGAFLRLTGGPILTSDGQLPMLANDGELPMRILATKDAPQPSELPKDDY